MLLQVLWFYVFTAPSAHFSLIVAQTLCLKCATLVDVEIDRLLKQTIFERVSGKSTYKLDIVVCVQ